MLGKLNDTQIEEVLANNVLGRIGCHDDGRTYIVPINYVYDGKNIIAHSTPGMKIQMMRHNPQVCFEVDVMEDTSSWKSVIAWGEFEELTNKEERNKAIRILMDRKLPSFSSVTTKLSADWPFAKSGFDDVTGIIFRVALKTKTGRFEKAGSASFVNI